MIPCQSLQVALDMVEKEESKKLGIHFDSNKKGVSYGEYVPKADAQSAPTISYAGDDNDKGAKYILFLIDPDAPYKINSFLSPLLHHLRSDLEVTTDAQGSKILEGPTESLIAEYSPPSPPPGATPHRYVFLLYSQPSDFDAKQYDKIIASLTSMPKRVRFDLDAFEKKAKLGPVIAATYFLSN